MIGLMQARSISVRRLIGPLWVLLFTFVAIGVFLLPYYIPVSARVVSDALRFGFNNHVAMASVFLGLTGATVLSMFSPLRSPTGSSSTSTGQIGITWLLVFCGIQTLFFVPLHWLADGNPPIGEAAYFLPRLYYMNQGLPLYRGFEFAYGPALAYVPFVAQHFLGFSPQGAYTWSVWLFGVAGYGILWGILRRARAGRFTKLAAFVCLVAWFHIGIAPQYTLLRFLSGLGALVLVEVVTENLRVHWAVLSLIYLGLTLGAFAISPEIGCAFIPGILAYLILEFDFGQRFIRVAGVYVLLTILAASIIPGEMFLSLRGFAVGGNAFPILPSPYMLLYLATLFVVVPPLLSRAFSILRRRGGRPLSCGPFGEPATIALGVTSVCMIPGALGRADVGHVYFYGIGVFLLGILGCRPSSKWLLGYSIALVIAFQIFGFALLFHFQFPQYLSAAGQKTLRWVEAHPRSPLLGYAESITGDKRWSASLDRARHVRELSLETNYSALAGIGPICANPGDRAAFTVLARHNNLKPQYFFDSLNVFSDEQRRRMRTDYESCRYLIQPFGPRDNSTPVPDNENSEKAAQAGEFPQFVQWNLCFPWLPHPILIPEPAATSERPDFVVLKQVNERWFLWARRGTVQE